MVGILTRNIPAFKGPGLKASQMDKVVKASREIPGWRGEIARFAVAMYVYTGLKLSELRLASVDDLNLNAWTLTVRHPKGERTYAKPRIVPIPDQLRPAIQRHMAERGKMLARRLVLSSKLLLCKKQGNPDEPYSVNSLQTLKKQVQDPAEDLRPEPLGQECVDRERVRHARTLEHNDHREILLPKRRRPSEARSPPSL